MKNIIIKISVLTLLLGCSADLFSQRHSKYMRRKERVAERIEKADREGKLDDTEKKEIAEKKQKLNRVNRRALRDGNISEGEQNRMNRKLRKVKRETRRSSKD